MNTFLFGLLVWTILGSQVFQLPQTSKHQAGLYPPKAV